MPWSEKSGRFTLLFEAFAIKVLQSARGVHQASVLLHLNWHRVEAIKARAVECGLSRRRQTKILFYCGKLDMAPNLLNRDSQ